MLTFVDGSCLKLSWVLFDFKFKPCQMDLFHIFFTQELWNAFQESPTQWVDLSGLDFDIEDEVVHQLVRAEIIENHPEEPSKVRLIDFTE